MVLTRWTQSVFLLKTWKYEFNRSCHIILTVLLGPEEGFSFLATDLAYELMDTGGKISELIVGLVWIGTREF